MNEKKQHKYRRLTSVITDKQEWTCIGSVSNITGGFSVGELGSIRRVERTVTRENFVQEFVNDIASLFNLNDGQAEMLNFMLQNPKFSGVFVYNEETKVQLAEGCKLSPITAHQYFRSMVTSKRLIRKVKQGSYRLNEAFLFQQSEIRVADFLSINLTYTFTDQTIIAKEPRITMEMIDAMIEIYRHQQAQEKKVKDMFGNQIQIKDATRHNSSTNPLV